MSIFCLFRAVLCFGLAASANIKDSFSSMRLCVYAAYVIYGHSVMKVTPFITVAYVYLCATFFMALVDYWHRMCFATQFFCLVLCFLCLSFLFVDLLLSS